MKTARIIYITILALDALYALLSEIGTLTTAFIPSNNETEYALNMLCIVFTLGASWGSLRLFATKPIHKQLCDKPHMAPTWNIVRESILGTAIFINTIVYYGMMNGTTPLFCLLITLTAYVFCWPKKDEISK